MKTNEKTRKNYKPKNTLELIIVSKTTHIYATEIDIDEEDNVILYYNEHIILTTNLQSIKDKNYEIINNYIKTEF